MLLISMLWHSKRFSNRKERSCLPLLNAGFEPRGSLEPNLQQITHMYTHTHTQNQLSEDTYKKTDIQWYTIHNMYTCKQSIYANFIAKHDYVPELKGVERYIHICVCVCVNDITLWMLMAWLMAFSTKASVATVLSYLWIYRSIL